MAELTEMATRFLAESDYYRLDDTKQAHGMFLVQNETERATWNAQKWGIFLTVQKFDGKPRKIENITRIRAWAVDLDKGEKDTQVERIKAGLVPSMVIETKRGYHVYWFAGDDARLGNYEEIIKGRLCPFYDADFGAADKARVLRAPEFYHWKNPAEPFLAKVVWSRNIVYTEKKIISAYPLVNKQKESFYRAAPQQNAPIPQPSRSVPPPNMTTPDQQRKLREFPDGATILQRLSGTKHVNFETFELKPHRQGGASGNVFVNGKASALFIDHNGALGSCTGHCPTPEKFLSYYGFTWQQIKQIVKEVFPEWN